MDARRLLTSAEEAVNSQRRFIAGLAMLLVIPMTTHAQAASRRAAQYSVEIVTRDRWLYELENPLHSPRSTSTTWIHIDSLRVDSTAGRRTLWAGIGSAVAGDPAVVTTALTGDPLSIHASLRQRTLPLVGNLDTARMTRLRVLGPGQAQLALPASRIWDLVPSFRPQRAAAGARWIDTIDHVDSMGVMRQSLRGVRASVIERDTVVNGRRLWIVRDSATFEYNERFPVDERRAAGPAMMERSVAGTVVGRLMLDPATGLARVRSDTAELAGTATLRYPDGRALASPVRYERSRSWSMYEPAELAMREAAIRAQRDSNGFSIVIVPKNEREARLQRGDSALIDSLFRVWTATRDPDERAEVIALLTRWPARDSDVARRVDSLRTAEQDLEYLFNRSARGTPQSRLTVTGVRFLLPYMQDPELAFRSGLSRDVAYEGMIETMLPNPPALEPDTAKWPCEPAACRLLADQWTTATEPRLRSVGLSVLALTDPVRWRDTFLAVAATGDNVSRLALPLLEGWGTSRQYPPPDRRPIPDAGADWTAWYRWFVGLEPGVAPAPPVSAAGRRQPAPWLAAHGNPLGIRMVEVATGRNIVAELRALHGAAANDTSRTLLGRILASLGEAPFGVDSLAEYVRNGSELMRSFAMQLLTDPPVFARTAAGFSLADTFTRDRIHGDFLAGIAARMTPWRTREQAEAGQPASAFRNPPSDAPGATHPVVLASDGVADSLVAAWSARLPFTTREEWNARPLREGGEAWILGEVQRMGPFVRFSYSVSGRIAREAGQAPQAWASWTAYYLMEMNGEWVIVATSVAVT